MTDFWSKAPSDFKHAFLSGVSVAAPLFVSLFIILTFDSIVQDAWPQAQPLIISERDNKKHVAIAYIFVFSNMDRTAFTA